MVPSHTHGGKRKRVRTIFQRNSSDPLSPPYNILNQTQLSQEVEQGVTLKDYIQQQSVGTLEPLGDGRLQLWKIGDPQQRNNARNYLKRQGLVIS